VGLAVNVPNLKSLGFTRYEAMNGGAKRRKWGGLGRFVAFKVIGNVTIR